MKSYIERSRPTLTALGLTIHGTPDAVPLATTAASAVEGAGFVQENVPQQLAIIHATFAAIDPVLQADAIVASSAPGQMLSQMQRGWKNPARFVLGHPFTPSPDLLGRGVGQRQNRT